MLRVRDRGVVIIDSIYRDRDLALLEALRAQLCSKCIFPLATKRLQFVAPIALLLMLCLLYAAMNRSLSALAIVATITFALTGGGFAMHNVPKS